MRSNLILASIGLASSLTWLGCAETIPKELVDARAAYDRASHGPAQDLTPADVHVARTSLEDAELAYDDEGDSQRTRDLAYVAMRRAEIAESKARTLAARKESERLGASLEQREQQQYAQTAAELNAARQQIQGQSAQLSQEQARRAEAEKRAQQAMQDLAQVAAVKEDSRGTVITLSGEVLFESGKAELKPVATAKLAQVADALTTSDPDSSIRVEGYTDSQGSQKFNEKLSQDRAEAVRQFLVSRGVASDRVMAAGFGPAKPVADNKSAEGRANNRRVEIVVQPSGSSQSPSTTPSTPSTPTTQTPSGA